MFSGSQIRSKSIEMIVSGDLTIESLRDTFMAEGSSSAISGSLAAVFSSIHKIDSRAVLDPRLSTIPTLRIADELEITEKVNQLAQLIGTEKFYLKVAGLLYKKGAEAGLKPDGILTKTDQEKIEALRILSENIPEIHVSKKSVINPSIGELVACMTQVDEFKQVRNQFITQRVAEGASMKDAVDESKEITPEIAENTKKLRVKKQAKKHELLEKIEEKLPQGAENQELRAKMLKAYLDEHGSELVAEVEQFTLDEIKVETELFGSVKSSKMSQFLRNYVEAEQTSEEFEKNTEAGICKAYTMFAEGFNNMMIPGYSAYASGGNTYEIVSSAGSDIVLTLCGGKICKMAWTGSKALYQGAKNLGANFTQGQAMEIAANKVPYNSRTMQQILARNGEEITSSTLPKMNAKNVKLAGQRHPETEIVFDQKGFPIFDDITVFDTRINGNIVGMTREQHMKLATSQLKTELENGKINKNIFNEIQLQKILEGNSKIPDFTWHHHQDIGRMQLVPTDVHSTSGHVGGFDIWK